jgi:aspartyl protease family protein
MHKLHRIRRLVICFLAISALLGPVGAADLRVSALALFKDKAVLEIDGRQRVLSTGEVSPEGVALVRASSERAEIELQGERLVLRLDGRIASDFGASVEPTIRLIPNVQGQYVVDGKINGRGVRFLVDTGATLIAVSKTDAKRLGLQFRVDGERGQVQTASGTAPAYFVRLDQVQVRTINLANIEAVVVDGDYPATPLLGQSFLNRINMRRDGSVLELIGR